MRLDVYFTPAEMAGIELRGGAAVVVDVLRATSTIVEALANGARAVFPVGTADDAARIAQNIGRDSVLLCGERKSLPIEGFDLGNAPPEFTRDVVKDKALVMTTTNGTRAFLALAERRHAGDGFQAGIIAGSFLNLEAVIEELAGKGDDISIICAGREGRFALEDAICAGAMARGIADAVEDLELNDGARAAHSLAARHLKSLEKLLARTDAGRHLRAIGREADLEFCAEVDRTAVIPRFADRKIALE